MTHDDLRQELAEARRTIELLQRELRETNREVLALTLDLEGRVHELQALNAAGAIVNRTQGVEELIQQVIDEPLRLAGVDAAAILLLDDEMGELELAARRGCSAKMATEGQRWKLGQGVAGRVVQSRAPLVIDPEEGHPGDLEACLESDSDWSMASIPLIGAEDVIGAMNVALSPPARFDERAVDLLMALGRQIAIGVEKARLREETQAWAEDLEERVEIRTAELRETNRQLEEEIAERQRTEAALRQSEERFRVVMKSSSIITAIVDRDLRYVWIENPHPEFDPEAVIGKRDDELADNEGARQLLELKRRVLEREKGERTEITFPLRDGPVTYDITAEPLRDTSGRVIGVTTAALDITKRKQAEEALEKYSAGLEELVEQRTKELREAQEQMVRQEKLATLGRLSGSVSHELRNPLGAIKNAAYFLTMAVEDPDPDVQEAIEILEREVDRSEGVIKGLLDFARAEPPRKRALSINQVLEETLTSLDVPGDVELVTDLDDRIPEVRGDADQLRQVFRNLAENGMQAMPDGGRLTVASRRASGGTDGGSPTTNGWVQVAVSDTGDGIPEGDYERIFEPLYTTKTKGIGLGLAIVQTIVEGHDGTIEVDSEVGTGSTFTVKLPVEGGQKGRPQ